MNKKRRQDPDQ